MEGFSELTIKQDLTHALPKDCSFSNKLDSKVSKSPQSNENLDHELRLSRSKLPRIVKTTSNTYSTRRPSDKKHDSGDSKPCTSQSSRSPPSRDESYCEGEKLKPSQIPRRRSISDTPTRESCNAKKFSKSTFKSETKNVQRIQVLNTLQDFYTDRPTASVGCSRPIPTLGHIYQRTGNRVTNWFMETDNNYLETLSNSLEANPSEILTGSACASQTAVDPEKNYISDKTSKGFRNTKENVCQWSDAEEEYPTRDSEIRHRSTSPEAKNNNSKQSDGLPIVKESENKHYITVTNKNISAKSFSSNEVCRDISIGTSLKEQPTVVLVERIRQSAPVNMKGHFKPETSMTLTQTSQSEFTKAFQFPSNPNPNNGTFAVSYVDCASEVLQKTTDFEAAAFQSSATLSIVGTDMEYRDFSSRGTFEHNDDFGMAEEDDSQWSYSREEDGHTLFSSSGDYSKSEQTTITDMQRKMSDASDAVLLSSGYHHRYSYFCLKKRKICGNRHGSDRYYDKTDRFKKYDKGRRGKEARQSESRKRLSFRRMCRRRWNYVCQKTAERWASWPKSSVKFKKFRMLYLHPEINWEDVDVQTAATVCRETATATIVKELKSAAIATSLRLSHLKTDAATSGKALTLSMLTNSQPPVLKTSSLRYPVPTLQKHNCNLRNSSHHKDRKPLEINLPIYRACEALATGFAKNLSNQKLSNDSEFYQKKSVNDGTQSEDDKTDSQDSQLFSIESKITVLSCAGIKRIKKDKSTQSNEFVKNASHDKASKSLTKSGNSSICNVEENAELKRSSLLNKDLFKCSFTESNSKRDSSKRSLASNIMEFKEDRTDFLLKFSNDVAKPVTCLKSVHLQQSQPAPKEILANVVTCDAGLNTPFSSKVCQTGSSNSWANFLCNRSTSVEYNTQISDASRHSVGMTTSNLTGRKSVETETEDLTKSSSKLLKKMSTGIATTATVYPVRITKGVSGSNMEYIVKKDASVETIPPIAYLGYKGPKIISISSCFLPTVSIASVKSKSQNTGPSSQTKVQVETPVPTQKRSRAWQLICCGTDTMSDVEGCSKSTIVETSDLETETVTSKGVKKKISKVSFTAGSYEIPLLNVETEKSVSVCVNTDLEQKYVSATTSRIRSETPSKADFSVQQSHYKEDLIRAYHSAAISCNLAPSVGAFDAVIATQTEKPPVASGHDQETHTVEELVSTNKTDGACSTEPDVVLSSDLNAEKWIRKCISNMDKDQIAAIIRHKSTEQNVRKESQMSVPGASPPRPETPLRLENPPRPETPPEPKTPSRPETPPEPETPSRPETPPSPPSAESSYASSGPTCSAAASLGVTCVACLKPQTSSPILPLPKAVPKESIKKESRLMNEEPTTNIVMSQIKSLETSSSRSPLPKAVPKESIKKESGLMNGEPIANLFMSMSKSLEKAKVRKDLKETVAQTALEVQDAATEPCRGEKKSESVFTSRYMLTTPLPCRYGACHHSRDCLYVYERPHCVVHRPLHDVSIQMQPSQQDIVLATMSVKPSRRQSVAVSTACVQPPRHSQAQVTELIGDVFSQLLGHPSKHRIKEPKLRVEKSTGTDGSNTFFEPTLPLPRVSMRSAGLLTSHADFGNTVRDVSRHDRNDAPRLDRKPSNKMAENGTQTAKNSFVAPVLSMPHTDEGYLSSCRYYGTLLSNKLHRVKDNITRHLTPSDVKIYDFDTQGEYHRFTEACTMKPSGRTEFCCQTDLPKRKVVKTMSCCTLDHAYSVTDFCRGHEKDNLNAVYCMLSAIEGRIRRLKRNTFTCR